jgi:hypothetical protein
MARSTSDGHHRGLNRIWRFRPVADRAFRNAHPHGPSRAATGYEPVAEEPPEVTAISCMRCVKPFSRAGISAAPAVGNSAIA